MARCAYVIEWIDDEGDAHTDDALEFYELSDAGQLRYQQTNANYEPQGIRSISGVKSVAALQTYRLDD